jgi:hypothetical protein
MTLVMSPRTSLALFVATALATRLIGGGSSQDTGAREPRETSARPAVSEPSRFAYSEQLRERLKTPVTPQPGRNPFLYGARHAARPSAGEAPMPEAAAPVLPPAPPAPPFKLSGIAMSGQGDAAVLTAIVIDHGVMVFAKAGDRLSNGHTVVRVDEMSVTLIDAEGVTETVRLP